MTRLLEITEVCTYTGISINLFTTGLLYLNFWTEVIHTILYVVIFKLALLNFWTKLEKRLAQKQSSFICQLLTRLELAAMHADKIPIRISYREHRRLAVTRDLSDIRRKTATLRKSLGRVKIAQKILASFCCKFRWIGLKNAGKKYDSN